MSKRDKLIQEFIKRHGENVKESAAKQTGHPFFDKMWAEEEWDECLYHINEDGLMVRMSLEESNAIKKNHKQKQDEDCDIDDYSLLDPSDPIYDDPELEEMYGKYIDYLNLDVPFEELWEPSIYSSDEEIEKYNKRMSIEFDDFEPLPLHEKKESLGDFSGYFIVESSDDRND